MITLGIECTAHTLGIGIFNGSRIIANESSTYSKKFGGMKPSDAADHHSRVLDGLVRTAFSSAVLNQSDIGLIGYSKGPGLAPCLRIGRTGAFLLSSILKIPIIPVHHSVAHIEIGVHICGFSDPLVIYVSGGNTQLLVRQKNHYAVLGETLDIGLGNAIDMIARSMGLEKAHGGEVERLAEKGSYTELPYTVKGMDFAFSGLATRCEQLLSKYSKEDISYSFQETAFSMLCEAAERALMFSKKKEVLLCGGVAQNRRLQEMIGKMCSENNISFGTPSDEYNRDNGAMIAYAAHYLHAKYGSAYPDDEITIKPKYRIEDAPS